jgi:hypothetical protein
MVLYESGGFDTQHPFLQIGIALAAGLAAYFFAFTTFPGKYNWDWGYRKKDPPA